MPVVKYLPRHRPGDFAPVQANSFFLVDLVSVDLKELVPHLEHPFFGLSKIPEKSGRRYEDGKGQYLEVRPDAEFGRPTIFDQDFVIYATSVLLAERQRLKTNPHREGQRRVSDEGVVAFSVADFAEFTGRMPVGRKSGGALYRQIEQGLRRISNTRLETNLAGGGYRALKFFGMINEASIIRREKLRPDDDGIMLGCQIQLSRWMMEAVNSNQVLRLNRDYFRLRRPLDRRLYQIVRKHCGNQEKWDIGLPKLYAKSGARTALKDFRYRVREFMDRWDERLEREDQDFLGYRMEYDPTRDMVVVHKTQPENVPVETLLTIPEQPSEDFMRIARAECPGYDPVIPYRAWTNWAKRQGGGVKHPEKAFRGFCVRWREDNPPLLAAAGLDTFPSTGCIEFRDSWNDLARDAGCNWDRLHLADEFRRFCRSKGIALDAPKIARTFHTFCRKLPQR